MALFNVLETNLLSHESTSGLLESKRGVLGKTYKVHEKNLSGLRINRNKSRQQNHQLPDPKSHVEDHAGLPSYLDLLLQTIEVKDARVEKAAVGLLDIGEALLIHQNQAHSREERNGPSDSNTLDAHLIFHDEIMTPGIVQGHRDYLAIHRHVIIFEAVEPSPLAVEYAIQCKFGKSIERVHLSIFSHEWVLFENE